MAFFATIEATPVIRRQAFAPGHTGGGNPHPTDPPIDDPRPMPIIKPRCVPTKLAYPSGTGWIQVKGHNGKGQLSKWYRYPCRRTTARRWRIVRQVTNTPYRSDMPLTDHPVGQLERNPRPVHGRVRPDTGFKRIQAIKNKVNEDNS